MRLLRRYVAASSAVLLSASLFAAVAPAAHADPSVVPAVAADIRISEVESNGGAPDDWIELHNTNTAAAEDLSGWWLQDNSPSDHYDITAAHNPGGSIVPAGGYLAFDVSYDHTLATPGKGAAPQYFGLGGADSARVYDANSTLVDHVDWTQHADDPITGAGKVTPDATYSRCAGSSGESAWVVTDTDTKGAANASCPAPGVVDTTAQQTLHVNEVMADNITDAGGQRPDSIELTNTGTVSQDVSGWALSDDKATDADYLPTGTVIAPGDHPTYAVGVKAGSAYASQDPFLATTFPGRTNTDFGLGAKGDNAALVFPNGTADVDRVVFGTDDGTAPAGNTSTVPAAGTGNTIGRCPDGTGAWAVTSSPTPDATNACSAVTPPPPTSSYDSIRINEIETNGDPAGDWIELANLGTTAVNISGMVLADDGGDNGSDNGSVSGHNWPVPGTTTDPTDTTTAGNTVLPAGGFVVFYSSNQFGFGLGAPDMARLFTPAHALVDSTAWTVHEAGVTYQRCPGATAASTVFSDTFGDPFVNSVTNSPGAANDCLPPVRINEVQANDVTGGHDWVELTNVGNQAVDLTGYVLTDDTDTGHQYVIGAGDPTTLAPGAFASYDVDDTSHAGNFGLGKKGDEVRLYEPGAFDSTAGAYRAMTLVDSFVFEDSSALPNADAHLPQTVTLPGGTWPVDATDPTSPVTYARCSDGTSRIVADGTGAWAVSTTPTKGTANRCDGLLSTQPWPDTQHGQAVATADSVDLGQNMSGLFYVAGPTPAQDYMWGIENGASGLAGANPGGAGALYKLVKGADGTWGPATEWTKGDPLRYPDGTGEPDAEGVTAVGGKVYAATERDNANNAVSKISVLEVDPSTTTPHAGDANGDLVATHEWDLGPVLGPNGTAHTGLDASKPGDANLGIEGVSFVPDAYLTGAGFRDQSTGAAYDPSAYPTHVDGGVFFVAMEKTGKLYGFVLNSDNTFTLVATVDTGFPTIMDVLWDPAQHALWATCDNSCQGRSSLITIATTGADQGTFQPVTVHERPTGAVDNLNNEGFTVQPATECVNGSKSAFWSDDTDDAQHWLRTAAVDCAPPAAGQVGATVTTSVSGTPSASGVYAGPVTVSVTCHDVDAVLNQPCPAPITVSATTPAHVVTTLTDTLGVAYPVTVPAITIDTTPPSAAHITITGPSGWQHVRNATFRFHSSDSDVVGYRCRLAGAITTFVACSGLYTATGLRDGSYTFGVEAVDGAGNVSGVRTQAFGVDTVAPRVRIAGVARNAVYVGVGPRPTCRATDERSGVVSCSLRVTRTPTSVHVVAVARDRAGNTATTALSYSTLPYYVVGAMYRNGVFHIVRGHTYTVVALTTGTSAPRLLGPVRSGQRLTGRGVRFSAAGSVDGLHRFTTSVRFTFSSGTRKLGVRVGGTVHVVRVHR